MVYLCLIWLVIMAATIGWMFLRPENKTLHFVYTVETDVDSVKEYITNNIPSFMQVYHKRLPSG